MESVPPQLIAIFRHSVQPYMISWLPIDPAQEVGHLTVPVLVVQGTTDIQVNKAGADRLVLGPNAPAAPSSRRVHREVHRSMNGTCGAYQSKT